VPHFKCTLTWIFLAEVFVERESVKSLLELLPKLGTAIVDSLKNETKYFRRLLFLIQETEETIHHFLSGNLSHFDPHVGDTACQIRAYYFALMYQKKTEITPELERAKNLLQKYAEQLMIAMDQGARNLHRPLRPKPLAQFLNELDLSFTLPENALVLSIAHILSKYRWVDEEGISNRIDTLYLQRSLMESRSFIEEFLENLQQRFAQISVDFLLNLSSLLQQFRIPLCSTPEFLMHSSTKDFLKRVQVPCLSTFEILIKSLELQRTIPIALVVSFLGENTQQAYFFF